MKPIVLYDNKLVNSSTRSASETASGYSVNNVIDYRPYTLWKAATTGVKTLYCTFSTPITINCIGVVNHNITRLRLLDGETLTARFDQTFTNKNAKLVLVTQFNTADLRIEITNNTEAPYCGVIFVGQYLEFPEYPDASHSVYNEIVETNEEINKNGYMLGANYQYTRHELLARFSFIAKSWVDTNFLSFWNTHAKLGKPFFWGYDIENDPEYVYYVRNAGNLKLEKQIKDYYDVLELTMEGHR